MSDTPKSFRELARRKGAAMKRKAKFRVRYSGPQSKEFWDAINGIEDKYKLHAAYVMGCNLQDIEVRTLQYINEVTRREKEGKRG